MLFNRTISQKRFQRGAYQLAAIILLFVLVFVGASRRLQADTGMCGGQNITLPFTDVMGSVFFCSIAEIYFQGITVGTTPTTYSPSNNVTRDQMAAFLSRTLDAMLQRGSERAAVNQFWSTIPHYDFNLGRTSLGGDLRLTRSDGVHVWVADLSGNVYQVRASDGRLQDTWTGATGAYGVLCAMGKIFVTGYTSPSGKLYMIDPASPAGVVTTVTSALGDSPESIAFDGNKIWTANDGSISIVTPGSITPWSVASVLALGRLNGLVYDGSNMWVTRTGATGAGSIKKLDSSGNVLQTIAVGDDPHFPTFDGNNIWVPSATSNTVTVVRASTGEVLATLSDNGLNGPRAAAFDGERILVTNYPADSISLWKASDLTPIGFFSVGGGAPSWGACSDGQYFWITLRGTSHLARF